MSSNGTILEWHGMSWPVDDVQTQSGAAVQLESRQIRAARALLDWSAQELAEASEVSFSTVRRMELDVATVKPDGVDRVRKTLESWGIRFALAVDGYVSVGSISVSGQERERSQNLEAIPNT